MNAIQPSRPSPLKAVSSRPSLSHSKQPISSTLNPRVRTRQQAQQHRKKHTYQAIALELSTKLVVNVLLTVAAAATLFKLVPYHLVQQKKLQSIQAEVANVEGRVAQLRVDFGRQFDPQQTMSVMQEQSNRVSPTQRRIVWSSPRETSRDVETGN
jgi:hypothetical protein